MATSVRVSATCGIALICTLAWNGSSAENALAAEAPTITLRNVPQPSSLGFETDPGIAPFADGQGELFSISGLQGSFGRLVEASPEGTLTTVGSSYDAQFLSSVVNAAGFDWLLTTEGLMAISPSGAVTNFQIALPAATDMTLGPDGNLYISNTDEDAILKCAITAKPSASCATTIPVPSTFASQAPQSIASAGGGVWFTTTDGELGSLTSGGVVGGPYDEEVSPFSDGPAGPNANMLATAPTGSLWTTAVSNDDDTTSQLVEINPSTGAVVARYGPEQGLPTNANIEGLTVGPDGNVWFIDSGGVGFIGALDVNDGRVTEFPFPKGYSESLLTPAGIATGPDDTVWFGASTVPTGDPAIGEISGLAAGSLTIGRVASTRGGSASLHVSCKGPSNAGCAGRVVLTATAPSHRHAGSKSRSQTVVTLGTARYSVAASHSNTLAVRLDAGVKSLWGRALVHGVTAEATATPQIGSPSRFTVLLEP